MDNENIKNKLQEFESKWLRMGDIDSIENIKN